jgi:hypothetical protein
VHCKGKIRDVISINKSVEDLKRDKNNSQLIESINTYIHQSPWPHSKNFTIHSHCKNRPFTDKRGIAVTSKIYHYYFLDAGGISKPWVPYIWKYVSILCIESAMSDCYTHSV